MQQELCRGDLMALVTLARHVMRADGRISDPELRAMMNMAREVGLATFLDALESTEDAEALDRAQLRKLAGLVTGRGRPKVLRHLANLAASDGLEECEAGVLDLIGHTWSLDWKAA